MNLAISDAPCGPRPRHPTVGVRVGEGDAAVTVGGGAPIVVQSMTNTDTADVEATARQVAALWRAGSELVRITVDRDEAAAAVPHIRDALLKRGVARAADRRLPLHRPQAARRSSGLRRSARQISHQSRQCRVQEQARPAIRQDRRDRDQERQAGAHRRQLGFARPGASDLAHGRERGERRAARGGRGHPRGDGADPRFCPRRGRRRSGFPASASSCRRKSRRCRTSSPSTACSASAPITRSISA